MTRVRLAVGRPRWRPGGNPGSDSPHTGRRAGATGRRAGGAPRRRPAPVAAHGGSVARCIGSNLVGSLARRRARCHGAAVRIDRLAGGSHGRFRADRRVPEFPKFDELKKLSEEYEDTGAARALTHGVVTQDREDPNLFRTIVEFPSYEAAMENSARPQTGEFANRMAALCDGTATIPQPRRHPHDGVVDW